MNGILLFIPVRQFSCITFLQESDLFFRQGKSELLDLAFGFFLGSRAPMVQNPVTQKKDASVIL